MANIVFSDITKKYGDKVIIDHMTLRFPESGFVCIAGPSGIGKTTILNLLLGLTAPDSGTVCIQDHYSVVFQEDRLLPWENVIDNVTLPLSGDAASKEAQIKKAKSILDELGLSQECSSYPSELSGGMARRVSIARALCVDADIYIMDEPTRGLDDETRKQVLQVIHQHTDRAVSPSGESLGRLLIMITHNPDETQDSVLITL